MGKVRRALAATDDETRLELSVVTIVLALMGLIALILIGLWLGGVWTGLIIVGIPLIAIAVLFTWGERSAQASDREDAQER
jgi:fatty acid desaturase